MSNRGTAADNSFTPVELEQLFATACRISSEALQKRHKNIAIQLAFYVYLLGFLGVRLGALLHFNRRNVFRDDDGEIIAIKIFSHDPCDRGDEGGICKYCQELAKSMAENAEDDDVEPEDFYDQYWGPKSDAGERKIPVRHERGKEIIEKYLEVKGSVDVSAETVRRHLTVLAEISEEIDAERMMPQSLRASAANYWLALDGFDIEGLKILMGWKYLSTAQHYVTSSFHKLWHKMGLALDKESDTPYNIDLEPATYEEIRSDRDHIHVEGVTPEGEISRHIYEYEPDSLKKEVEEYQSNMSQFSSMKVALEPIIPTIRARLSYEYESLNASPSLRRLAAAGIGLLGVAVMMGTLFAFNGFLEELLAGETQAVASWMAAIVIALPWMVWNIHDTHHDDPQAVEPETFFDMVILWTHRRIDPIAKRYFAVEEKLLTPINSLSVRTRTH
jgi:hypothetical protein